MPRVKRGALKPVRPVNPKGYRKKPVVHPEHDERDPRPVSPGRGRRGQQTEPTKPAEGPGKDQGQVGFMSYRPLDTSKLVNVKIPVDPSGAASENGVVAMVGNVYLAVSADDGVTFKYFDPTTMFPKLAGGLVGDQQIVYVPHIDRFVWIMLHDVVAATGDGAFRLAFASSADVKSKPKSAWVYVDFLASDIGVAGAFLDQPHLSYSDRNLIIAVDATSKGRVVVRIPLTDLTTSSVGWDFTGALTLPSGNYQFSAPCGGRPKGAYLAGHVNTSTIRVVALPDGTSTYATHDVTIWKWSDSNDYSSKTPSSVDWCGRCGSRISGATWRDGELWFAWMAPRSKAGDKPFYPEPHTRVVNIDATTFAKKSEMQVWNPKYAFGYSGLAVNSEAEVAISVAWGGPSNEADAAFGILGDFVVWYRDGSTATVVDGPKKGRWGDFLRTHRSERTGKHLDGFGYFTNKKAGKILQNPYHVRYGRS
jgi:hypothetical protein